MCKSKQCYFVKQTSVALIFITKDLFYILALIGYALADGGAHAPATNYGAASAQSQYGSPTSDSLGQYGDNDVAASDQDSVQGGSGDPIEDLKNNIPGVPGEDYPILAEVPELSFTCEGRIAGGKCFYTFS